MKLSLSTLLPSFRTLLTPWRLPAASGFFKRLWAPRLSFWRSIDQMDRARPGLLFGRPRSLALPPPAQKASALRLPAAFAKTANRPALAASPAPTCQPTRPVESLPDAPTQNSGPKFPLFLQEMFGLEELHIAYALQLSFDEMNRTRQVAVDVPTQKALTFSLPQQQPSVVDPRDALRLLARESLGLSPTLDGPREHSADI